jgi:hypothetical protein
MIDLSELIANVRRRFKETRTPAATRRFAAHNRRVFSPESGAAEHKPVVLFELNQLRSAHIAYSYLASVLAAEHKARIVAYVPGFLQGWRQYLYFGLKQALAVDEFRAYSSFGTTEFLALGPTAAQKAKAQVLFETVLPRLQSNRDIEELILEGTLVGDLIYDSYLAKYRRPTIDRRSPEFHDFLLHSIELFLAWNDYFDSHDVRAVNVSHCVYNVAMPLRIAVKRGIPAYQANATHLYHMTEHNMFAYNDFVDFPKRFAALPLDVRTTGVAEAKRRIERRFAGQVGVDMEYSTKSAYGKNEYAQLLRPSPRKKILIATHCFFDSPHSYGNNIFPDFHEWLSFLGEITKVTDYDWYIKTHPDYLPGTKEIIDAFVAKYPKFTLLPADSSHHQIIAEGIDLALTVFGTIGFEYAALGVPVINASQNNPHIAYSFNRHAKDVDDYRRMLLNFDQSDFNIDKQKVCEYYFMRFIYNTENLLFENYYGALEYLGGYISQFQAPVYDRWLQEWSGERHQAIVKALKQYVRSGDFRMDYTHYDREFALNPKEAAA